MVKKKKIFDNTYNFKKTIQAKHQNTVDKCYTEPKFLHNVTVRLQCCHEPKSYI